MQYYIIAGEASGDLHASNLMRELKKIDSDAQFRFWGGDLMAAEGGDMVSHYHDTAYMGVAEVVKNLPSVFKNFRRCEQDIVDYNPDVVILVDYPGFNLRMAKFASKNGFKVYYYIAPKVWAWNRKRVHKIRKYVDKVFTILPFEKQFYAKYNVPVEYSGSPVVDAVHNRKNKEESRNQFITRCGLSNKPLIALLAGSRKEEVQRMLPEMISMKEHFPDYQFVIAGAPSFKYEDYEPFIEGVADVEVLFDETYSLLDHSHASMVTSGTATLEAALLKSPQVVCYTMWGGWFTDFVSKKIIIKVPYISLVNLIMNREVVKELFQKKFSREALLSELKKICYDKGYRQKMLRDYEELDLVMGKAGTSSITARLMWDDLSKNKENR
ncbi:lipid-A-disaccharide synthase [Marinilabiliaceae bacterium ANBcel2]|nr:lipid-A-disaccharide synthase [Marinilabiliaceae bacterium ANBcel2]